MNPYGQPGAGQPEPPSGQWGPANPYGQPAAPSQPFYGQPGAPSQPFYGQPGAPSQPWAPTWDQTLAGQPQPTAPRKSRRKLWIALGVIVALLALLGGGGVFAFAQYIAPATAAGTFCGDFKAENYTAAYALLSTQMRSQFTADQFTQAARELDEIEGHVTTCTAGQGSGVYSYSLGSSAATATLVMTRATAGNLSGQVRLKNDNGGWKVDGLATSLFGVNLGALNAAIAYCTAMRAQDYNAAYALLGANLQGSAKAADYSQGSKLRDQIDGAVSACKLTGLGTGNSDSTANLSVSVTRGKLGQKQGAMSLIIENGSWKISNIASSVQGTDVGPALVGARFCSDLKSASYADIYNNLMMGTASSGLTLDQFSQILSGSSNDVMWSDCTPDLSTYTVSASTASLKEQVEFTRVSTGQTAQLPITFVFTRDGSAWKISDLKQ